jgi:hypothetical protein
MADAPTDAVPQILIKIQESIAALRSEMGQFRQSTETRFERVETLIRKQRRDAAGMLVMMRATASDSTNASAMSRNAFPLSRPRRPETDQAVRRLGLV